MDDGKSKWTILSERAASLRAQAEAIEAELAGLDRTPFGHECAKCGETLASEGDFARHFLVNDPRWLNLGRCPRAQDGVSHCGIRVSHDPHRYEHPQGTFLCPGGPYQP